MNDIKVSQKENYNVDKEQIFTVVTDENYKELITNFCVSLFEYETQENKSDEEILKSYVSSIEKLLNQFPRPYTIVQELYHIDACFRDSYYNYFSNQHFPIKRYSKRLSFFVGKLDFEDFFGNNTIENEFMGTCVINPILSGMIGRTLVNPKYLMIFKDTTCFFRLSNFKVHIYGRTFRVDAFPYRMQDEETMRCTQVTLLNILDYYSNSYANYRSIVPSEILSKEQNISFERVLPSKGMTYPVFTKVLSEFGFSPKLYNIASIEEYPLSRVSRKDILKRWLYYYVESGIPVALNLAPVQINDSGHSIVCIGHGELKESLWEKANENKWISWKNRDNGHPIINAADLYDEFVVVDDNVPIYQCKHIDELSSHKDLFLQNIAVPLYKRMFLDAPDASSIIHSLLNDSKTGIDSWTNGFLDENEDVVMRLFLTSSHSYKEFRASTAEGTFVKATYAILPMPRFVWVCELYRKGDFKALKAFGEIVLDATSAASSGEGLNNVILMRYPKTIGLRYPDQQEIQFDDMVSLKKESDYFQGFTRNLKKIQYI